MLGKELRVSCIVGAVLGLVNGLRIYPMYGVIYAGKYDNVLGYALVVSISLFISVVLAKLVGGMLPLAAKKLVIPGRSWPLRSSPPSWTLAA